MPRIAALAVALVLVAGLVPLSEAGHPDRVLLGQSYEYYVGGFGGIPAARPVCHVGEYREDPVSVGGACIAVAEGAVEAVIRLPSGNLQATLAHWTLRDSADHELATGTVCVTSTLALAQGAALLEVLPDSAPPPGACDPAVPAWVGYVGVDFYA